MKPFSDRKCMETPPRVWGRPAASGAGSSVYCTQGAGLGLTNSFFATEGYSIAARNM